MGTPGQDIRIMLGKVRDAVKAATGGRQEPFTYGSVGGETIALLPGDGPTAAPGLLPRRRRSRRSQTNRKSSTASYWRTEVGSVLELQDNAGAVTIRYLKVGGLGATLGITPGTIVFRGQRNAQELVGVATAFYSGGSPADLPDASCN